MPAAALLGLVMCRLVPLLCGDNQVVMGEGTQSLFRRRPGANRKAPEDGERRSTVNTAIHMSTGTATIDLSAAFASPEKTPAMASSTTITMPAEVKKDCHDGRLRL
jgi:hypothetical protein